MIASILSVLGFLAKLPELFLSFWRWTQRNTLQVHIASLQYCAMSECGTAIEFRLLNRIDQAINVSIFVKLNSGEELIPRTGNMWNLNPRTIGPRSNNTINVPLTTPRPKPHLLPLIHEIILQDELDRIAYVPSRIVEQLNDQILNNWDFAEDELKEYAYD